MVKTSITKEFIWNMAHMLAGHDGLCSNLHGHTYKMHIEVSKLSDDSLPDMVIDFHKLKKIVEEKIITPIDHGFMYWSKSTDKFEHEIAKLFRKHGKKIIEVEFRTTVEEIALHILKISHKELECYNIGVNSVIIWETPTSYAKVIREVHV